MVNFISTNVEKNTFGSLKSVLLLVKESCELNSCCMNKKSSDYYLELQLCNFYCLHRHGIPFIITRHVVMLGRQGIRNSIVPWRGHHRVCLVAVGEGKCFDCVHKERGQTQ